MSATTWRLIGDEEFSGAQNMARDEALLLCADENSPPVLRFYDWNPACVSIGRLQKDSSFIIENSSFDFVRRPTGGRAVLHQSEITYCAVLHRTHLPPESRSVVGAYNWFSSGFIAGLKTLGVQAELAAAPRKGSTPFAANCFQSAAQCDFVVDNRKLIGAAQCRKNDVILQHGSLLLDVDETAWRQATGETMSNAVSLRALGVSALRVEIIQALCAGMESVWNISFENSVFSGAENQMADALLARKYALAAWNENGIAALEL